MPADVVMPQLGLTMTEGAVTAWLKKPGDRIEKGEVLFIVETDKVEMEVESTTAGFLQSIAVELGQKVNVGTVIAAIGETAKAEPVAHAANGKSSIAVSPRARKAAKQLGVDLALVTPSRGHRVVEKDVLAFRAAHKADAPQPAATPSIRPDTQQRNAIAERLTASFERAPHFYLGVEVNATELVRLREKLGNTVLQRVGAKLTYTDFFLMALAKSLSEHESVNSAWRDGGVVRNSTVNVGLAVQGPQSLLVPVIPNANRLTLPEMARDRSSIAEKARTGKLSLRETEGGGATLSNLGPYGIDWFQGILNPPQSVLVATGRIAKRAVVEDDRVVVCPMLTVTVAADHRVLDGVAAAKFLGRIAELLQDPYSFLL